MKHPYTDDQDEVDNKTIVAKLKQSFGEAKDSWVDELPEVLWVYRCSPHDTTRETPFNLMYGTKIFILLYLIFCYK